LGIVKLSRTNLIFLDLSSLLGAGLAAGIGIGLLLFAATRLIGVLVAPGTAFLGAAGLAAGGEPLLVSGCATDSFGWVVGMLVFLSANDQ
jgi:hypothetical protein